MKELDVFRYLRKYRAVIAGVSVLAGIIFFLIAQLRIQQYTAVTVIEYTNSRADEGYSPDGKKIDTTEIYATNLVAQAMKELGIDYTEATADSIRMNIHVEPVITDEDLMVRIPVNNTKSVLGLFREDRYKSIFEAFFNLMFSVALAKQWGIEGIMAGTLLSTLLFPFWCEPFVLCHWGLHISVGKYFMFYLVHISFTAVIGVMTWLLCRTIGEGVVCFLLKGLICTIVPNAVYMFVYQQRDELLFFKETVKHMIQKII